MVNAGKTTLQFNVANTFYDANDRIVFIYATDTANTANNIAQTATITVTNFANALASALQISVQQADPANSTALTISQGQIFASNSYLYIAIANNVTRRVALSSF